MRLTLGMTADRAWRRSRPVYCLCEKLMMTMSEQYQAIAAQHREEAEATTLANVRQRYLQSETAWLRMAERALQNETRIDRNRA